MINLPKGSIHSWPIREDFEVNILEEKLPSTDEGFLGIEGFVKINKRIMFSKLRVKNVDVIEDMNITIDMVDDIIVDITIITRMH